MKSSLTFLVDWLYHSFLPSFCQFFAVSDTETWWYDYLRANVPGQSQGANLSVSFQEMQFWLFIIVVSLCASLGQEDFEQNTDLLTDQTSSMKTDAHNSIQQIQSMIHEVKSFLTKDFLNSDNSRTSPRLLSSLSQISRTIMPALAILQIIYIVGKNY